jgi:hypothetical protein
MSGEAFPATRCPLRQPLESPRELKMTTRAIVDCQFCCGFALFFCNLLLSNQLCRLDSLSCSTSHPHPRSGRLPCCKGVPFKAHLRLATSTTDAIGLMQRPRRASTPSASKGSTPVFTAMYCNALLSGATARRPSPVTEVRLTSRRTNFSHRVIRAATSVSPISRPQMRTNSSFGQCSVSSVTNLAEARIPVTASTRNCGQLRGIASRAGPTSRQRTRSSSNMTQPSTSLCKPTCVHPMLEMLQLRN